MRSRGLTVRRVPPRQTNDRFNLPYDMSTRYGWGMYAERGERGGSLCVWEEDVARPNSAPLVKVVSDESLIAIASIGRELGMV